MMGHKNRRIFASSKENNDASSVEGMDNTEVLSQGKD